MTYDPTNPEQPWDGEAPEDANVAFLATVHLALRSAALAARAANEMSPTVPAALRATTWAAVTEAMVAAAALVAELGGAVELPEEAREAAREAVAR